MAAGAAAAAAAVAAVACVRYLTHMQGGRGWHLQWLVAFDSWQNEAQSSYRKSPFIPLDAHLSHGRKKSGQHWRANA